MKSRTASKRAARAKQSLKDVEGRFEALQQAVKTTARELHREGILRPGVIVFRAPDSEATFAVRVDETGVQLEFGGDYGEPLLEVRGNPRRIQAIQRGKKDARKQFFAGGIRVRGDMHYLNELGMRLGFLKTSII
jgi:hypothetical protein